MADLRSDFVGIKSPNPFWLASAPPTDKEYNVVRAFKAGWGGVVWKTLGEDPPIVNVTSRYGAMHLNDDKMIGFNNIELITDRPLEINLREIKQVKRDWPDRAMVVSLMVPCEETRLVADPEPGRGDRGRCGRAQFRLPPWHVGARHGLGGGAGAGLCRDGGPLVQGPYPHAGAGEADTQCHQYPGAGAGGAEGRGGRRSPSSTPSTPSPPSIST